MICSAATIGFDKATYEFVEAYGPGTMNVVLTGELDISVTVLVSTIAGTATGRALIHTHVCSTSAYLISPLQLVLTLYRLCPKAWCSVAQ